MFPAARNALERALSRKHATTVVVVIGLLLVSSSLTSGLAADDWFHRLVLTGSDVLGGVHHRPMDLFVFSDGNAAVGRAQQESGMVGWWADPKAALAYFRPLSAATHWLDYRLWPNSPVMMHVQSLLWYALALVMLSRVYARFFEPAWASVLALLLYVVDDAHGFVVSWIANRNALITLGLGLPVLLLHDRSRRGDAETLPFAAALLFFVALFGGESAVAVGGYVLAYALFMDSASLRRRVLSVVPYAVAFVVWRIIYAGLGYGTHGSGLSVDPAHEPLEYARAVLVRLPVLLLAQFAVPPSDLWELFPILGRYWTPLVYAAALFAAGGIGWLVWPALRRERVTRFWALGTVLATLPACSQVPADRLLLYVGVGAHALVARFLVSVFGDEPWTVAPGGARVVRRIAAFAFVLLHLVLAPLWLPFRSRGPADVTSLLSLADRTLPSDAATATKTVVLVNPPADAFAGYLLMMRAGSGRTLPGRLRWLATGASAMRVERVDARTLRVELEDGFLSLASERMQRSRKNPIRVGDEIALSGMTITITKDTPDERPKEVLARFDVPLEDGSLVFLQWTTHGYAPFAVPAVGRHVDLPRLDFTTLKI